MSGWDARALLAVINGLPEMRESAFLSKFVDAARGAYFRKSKQVEIEQKQSRIEQLTLDLSERTAQIETLLAEAKISSGLTVEDVLAKVLANNSVTLSPKKSPDASGWFDGMEFSEDWTSANFEIWSQIFAVHGGAFRNGLEIGSFEGRSAVFFLESFPQIHLCCVDLFDYTEEFFPDRMALDTDFRDGQRFDKNLTKYRGRYEKVVAPSAAALARFITEGRKFDFIYIDGSHYRDDVLVDALLAWKLLSLNGVMIFDDYIWRWDAPSIDRPKDSIEYFVYSHLNELAILHKGTQFIIKKVS